MASMENGLILKALTKSTMMIPSISIKKYSNTGGESELHKYENMVHAFPILAPMFPEATEALTDICSFINDKLS